MPRMTTKEFQMWKQRLEWADRVWEDKGFKGKGEKSFYKYLKAYRGEYPELEGWGGLDLTPVPVIFSTASATCLFTVARYHWDGTTLTCQGTEDQTITAKAAVYTWNEGNPGTREIEALTNGCSIVKIFAAAPSAGTITFGPEKVY